MLHCNCESAMHAAGNEVSILPHPSLLTQTMLQAAIRQHDGLAPSNPAVAIHVARRLALHEPHDVHMQLGRVLSLGWSQLMKEITLVDGAGLSLSSEICSVFT